MSLFQKTDQQENATKNQQNRDFKKIRNRRLDLNITNKMHRNKSENFFFIKRFDEQTRKILKIVKVNVLRQLTIIVINSTESYFVTSNITEFTKSKNELKRITKSRILSQVNEIFANLFKYGKKIFFTKNLSFHNKKTKTTTIFVFLTKNSTTISKNDEIKTKKVHRQ